MKTRAATYWNTTGDAERNKLATFSSFWPTHELKNSHWQRELVHYYCSYYFAQMCTLADGKYHRESTFAARPPKFWQNYTKEGTGTGTTQQLKPLEKHTHTHKNTQRAFMNFARTKYRSTAGRSIPAVHRDRRKFCRNAQASELHFYHLARYSLKENIVRAEAIEKAVNAAGLQQPGKQRVQFPLLDPILAVRVEENRVKSLMMPGGRYTHTHTHRKDGRTAALSTVFVRATITPLIDRDEAATPSFNAAEEDWWTTHPSAAMS